MAILQVGAIPLRKMGMLDIGFRLFMRLVAVGCVISGLHYWSLLIGYADGGAGRFDLVAVHWQVPSVALAVLMPVAAVGLWMEVSWGAVIWVVAAGAEVLMHGWLTGWYGERQMLVGMHLTVALTYAALRLARAIRDRGRTTAVTTDSL
ncbi:hypothetical protein DFR52_10196 [Hoeflea marina]|uniref:Uncharacterized protein n=1 Tax=Hoeflea marina TaxID=274592 RepID=A0A317PT50_9HYPH|nr:DUF6163 family protein [Hoeflea marina]PWW03416.1 hypothetical protein DFR52_10196 [Hoeflea marina]